MNLTIRRKKFWINKPLQVNARQVKGRADMGRKFREGAEEKPERQEIEDERL